MQIEAIDARDGMGKEEKLFFGLCLVEGGHGLLPFTLCLREAGLEFGMTCEQFRLLRALRCGEFGLDGGYAFLQFGDTFLAVFDSLFQFA